MGWLDRLFQAAPGIAAKGLRGSREGTDLRLRREQDEQERKSRAEQDALRTLLLQRNEDRQAAREPLELDALRANAESTRALANQRAMPEPPPNVDPWGKDAVAAKERLARLEASLRPRPAGAGGTPPGRILPASEVGKIGAYKNVLTAAKTAQVALQEARDRGENVTGPLVGRTTAIVEGLGMAKPSAISVRGKLSNITSEIMKQRSGGAITPQEFERLEPFLANKNDTEENAAQKITDLITYLEGGLATTLDTFQESGYRIPQDRPPSAGGVSGVSDGGDYDPAKAKAELDASRARRAARKP